MFWVGLILLLLAPSARANECAIAIGNLVHALVERHQAFTTEDLAALAAQPAPTNPAAFASGLKPVPRYAFGAAFDAHLARADEMTWPAVQRYIEDTILPSLGGDVVKRDVARERTHAILLPKVKEILPDTTRLRNGSMGNASEFAIGDKKFIAYWGDVGHDTIVIDLSTGEARTYAHTAGSFPHNLVVQNDRAYLGFHTGEASLLDLATGAVKTGGTGRHTLTVGDTVFLSTHPDSIKTRTIAAGNFGGTTTPILELQGVSRRFHVGRHEGRDYVFLMGDHDTSLHVIDPLTRRPLHRFAVSHQPEWGYEPQFYSGPRGARIIVAGRDHFNVLDPVSGQTLKEKVSMGAWPLDKENPIAFFEEKGELHGAYRSGEAIALINFEHSGAPLRIDTKWGGTPPRVVVNQGINYIVWADVFGGMHVRRYGDESPAPKALPIGKPGFREIIPFATETGIDAIGIQRDSRDNPVRVQIFGQP